ncbi:hypothetical protein BGZ54_007201, partial [Gamsiella multidivaricata]
MATDDIAVDIDDNINNPNIGTNADYTDPGPLALRIPEILDHIIKYLPTRNLYEFQLVSKLWRQTALGHRTAYGAFVDCMKELYASRPRHKNIYMLNTYVLQYSANDTYAHSRPNATQFVFSCQTGSGSGDRSYSNHDHPHKKHCNRHGDGALTSQSGYSTSEIIKNFHFRRRYSDSDLTSSTSRIAPDVCPPPPVHPYSPYQIVPSDQHESINRLMEAHSISGPSSADFSGFGYETGSMDFGQSSTHASSLRVVPCPFETLSDGSLSNDDGSPSNESPSASTALHGGPECEFEETSAAMEWAKEEKHKYVEFKRGTKRSRDSKSSRNWSVSVQTYFSQRAALNAMIKACKDYMHQKEDEMVSVLEKGDALRIVWNESTRQEYVWEVVVTDMDRADPGDYVEEDYVPKS